MCCALSSFTRSGIAVLASVTPRNFVPLLYSPCNSALFCERKIVTCLTLPALISLTKLEYCGSASWADCPPVEAIFHKTTARRIINSQNRIVRTVEFTSLPHPRDHKSLSPTPRNVPPHQY